MKRLSLFIATTALVAGLGLTTPLLAQTTTKVMLTAVDPAVLAVCLNLRLRRCGCCGQADHRNTARRFRHDLA